MSQPPTDHRHNAALRESGPGDDTSLSYLQSKVNLFTTALIASSDSSGCLVLSHRLTS